MNYANVMGLRQDTKISADQFSQLALVFYVTYLAFEFPTGYLMQRLPTAKYLGANVILWGLMTALVSTAKNWAGLVTLRVLLGCFEAVVAPALVSQIQRHAPFAPPPGNAGQPTAICSREETNHATAGTRGLTLTNADCD